MVPPVVIVLNNFMHSMVRFPDTRFANSKAYNFVYGINSSRGIKEKQTVQNDIYYTEKLSW